MAHYYTNDECNECELYVHPISTSQSWNCICCGIHEMEIYYKDIPMIWNMWQLACSHYAHIRCYRVWCKKMDKVGCPVCGSLNKLEKNQYCQLCKQFGHSEKKCPILEWHSFNGYITSIWES